ncbi:hypothetical protein IJT93_01095 [bacterium]|nr:hypothetical protein [bacterium]
MNNTNTEINVEVLACRQCGAPMYPDHVRSLICCAFCGYCVPFSSAAAGRDIAVKYKHRTLEIKDGLLNLMRAQPLSAVPNRGSDDYFRSGRRWRSLEKFIETVDKRAFETYRKQKKFVFSCLKCGGEVGGSSAADMAECRYCGMKFGFSGNLEFKREKITRIIGYEGAMPGKCLPFKISLDEAGRAARRLAEAHRADFGGFSLESVLNNESFGAFYVPGDLRDYKILAEVIPGSSAQLFYLEWINWINLFDSVDIDLFDRLAPWNFNEIGPFNTDYTEGMVRFVAVINALDDPRDDLMCRRITEELNEVYNLGVSGLFKWGKDFQRHSSAVVSFPIYYWEYRGEDKDKCLNIMVNGQSGKAAAAIRRGRSEKTFVLEPSEAFSFSGEVSMRSKPVPVKYVKPKFLYEVLPPDQAVRRGPVSSLRNIFNKIF